MNPFRLAEEKRRFAESDRQELEARLAPVKAETSQALAQHENAARAYWSQPVAVLARALQNNDPTAYMGAVFATTQTPQPNEGQEVFVEAYDRIQRTGHVLSPVGRQRVLLMAVHQCLAQNADLSNTETYITCFNKLLEWDAFEQSGVLELGYDENKKEVLPEPVAQERRLTVDDLESIDTETREGEKIAHQIIAEAVFGDEAASVFHRFIAHVAKTFGHDISADEQREIILWFQKNNRNFLDHRAYDQCKVNLVRRGILPSTCLTEEEVLAGSIENEDTQSYESRRRLKQEILAARRR
jgi:hypothetical protein